MPSGISYNHETVALDGESFSDCEFRDCRLIYSGGEPPHFSGCKFADCEWKFEDGAANTLAYLKLVWGLGEKALIQGLIKEITGAAR